MIEAGLNVHWCQKCRFFMGLGFRVQGPGFRVSGSGSGGSGFRGLGVQGLEIRTWTKAVRTQFSRPCRRGRACLGSCGRQQPAQQLLRSRGGQVCTLNIHSTRAIRPSMNQTAQAETLNPKPSSPNPKPQTLSALNLQVIDPGEPQALSPSTRIVALTI